MNELFSEEETICITNWDLSLNFEHDFTLVEFWVETVPAHPADTYRIAMINVMVAEMGGSKEGRFQF